MQEDKFVWYILDQPDKIIMYVSLPSMVGLDVISEEHWPALNGFCREILDDTELVAIGPLADSSGVQSTHTVLHTKQNRTYIRGSSSLFHLCKYIILNYTLLWNSN